jgi:hypothetical protein
VAQDYRALFQEPVCVTVAAVAVQVILDQVQAMVVSAVVAVVLDMIPAQWQLLGAPGE